MSDQAQWPYVGLLQRNAPSRPIDPIRSKLQKTVNRALCRCEFAHFRATIAPSVSLVCPCASPASTWDRDLQQLEYTLL